MCTAHYFDVKFMGTIFGICNTVARAVTISAPMVAELSFPIPVVSIVATCSIAGIMSLFLKEKADKNDDEEDASMVMNSISNR